MCSNKTVIHSRQQYQQSLTYAKNLRTTPYKFFQSIQIPESTEKNSQIDGAKLTHL